MTSKTVFVVGTPEGAKVNQYEHMTNCAKEAAKLAAEMGTQGVMHMTNCAKEAAKLAAEMGTQGVIKEVKVPPSRHRGGR